MTILSLAEAADKVADQDELNFIAEARSNTIRAKLADMDTLDAPRGQITICTPGEWSEFLADLHRMARRNDIRMQRRRKAALDLIEQFKQGKIDLLGTTKPNGKVIVVPKGEAPTAQIRLINIDSVVQFAIVTNAGEFTWTNLHIQQAQLQAHLDQIVSEPETASLRRGRRPGSGKHDEHDEPRLLLMREMLQSGAARTRTEAALAVIEDIEDQDERHPDSVTVHRLLRKYRNRYGSDCH